LNYLSSFRDNNLIDTILPASYLDKETSLMIPTILMVSVSDSLGGITNLTFPLNVTSVETIDFTYLYDSKDSDIEIVTISIFAQSLSEKVD
jgi:hypothetical protein